MNGVLHETGGIGAPLALWRQGLRAYFAANSRTTVVPVSNTFSLVGMPGGGKSTVGRHLARHLGLPFHDTDHEIEAAIGTSVRDFFSVHGEGAFRDLEHEAIDALSKGRPCVLATGGGAVLREDNRSTLRERTTVIYLRSTPEELFRRLRHDTQRPLLQVADPLRRLRDLFRERDPLYRRCAHYIIETGRPSVPALVHMILMQLELAGLVDAQRVPSPIDPAGARGGPAEAKA
jgi:shikimate kinase